MSGSSSEIKDDENGEENIYNTEENVINNKNKIVYFSIANISKYKKYLNNNNNNENRNKKENKVEKTKSYINKIINIDIIDNENIDEEKICKKINIYRNNSDNKQYINEEQIKKIKEKNNRLTYNNSSSNIKERKKVIKEYKHKRNPQKNIDNILNEINNIYSKNISNQKFHSIIKQRKSFKDIFLFITLDNPQFFEISHILINNNNNINYINDEYEEENDSDNDSEKIPIFNNNWEKVNQFKKINNTIEFKNIALRTINEVNYITNGVEIYIDLSLIGNSEFWIFTRYFVNKDFNESELFDTFSVNNESDVIFNKYTSLIKIIKEKNSSKCFVTFGTFYEDENDGNEIKHETFLKRQLVDFLQLDNINTNNSNSIYYYLENDLLDIRVIIVDLGNEIIDAKILINNNQKYNHIEGKFYLPTIKRSKLLFCGIGQSVLVRKLRINNIEKFEDTENNDMKKSCSCCNIF